MMKTIKVGRSHVAMVDDDVFEIVNSFRWQVGKSQERGLTKPIVAISAKRDKTARQGRNVEMGRMILGLRRGQKMRHLDGNGLNNQADNLIHEKPAANRVPPTEKSIYRGVWYNKNTGKYRAFLKGYHGKTRGYIGEYSTEAEAVAELQRARAEMAVAI